MSSWDIRVGLASKASVFLFFCACVLVFSRPRIGYGVGLFAGLIALPWFVLSERLLGNSWIFLNYEAPVRSDSGLFLTFVKIKVLSVALIVTAAACASLRLLPARLSVRGHPLRRRTWPAFAVGLLVMTTWFLASVTPYSVPGFDHVQRAELRILHVQKRGLHFQETAVVEFKDGRAFVVRSRRRLFQYRFVGTVAMTALATSPDTLERARGFVQSPELGRLPTMVPNALRSWNAEGWYVVLKDSRLLAFTTESRTTPPKEVTDLFYEVERLPALDESSFAVRDVCLGFCYDPVAALGFSLPQQRTRLLSLNASQNASSSANRRRE
jgi:hypothetical protein